MGPARPSSKIDRLAAVRAAKAAIQGGQQQQQQASQSHLGPHPLPPRQWHRRWVVGVAMVVWAAGGVVV